MSLDSKLRQKYVAKLSRKYGKKCQQCGRTDRLTLDHIIPTAARGSNTIRNLQLLCKQHNYEKAIGQDLIMLKIYQRIQRYVYNKHFDFSRKPIENYKKSWER